MGKPFSPYEIGIYLGWVSSSEVWFGMYELGILMQHEKTVQILFYLVVFGLMALWEWKSSFRVQKIHRNIRWPNNMAVSFLSALVVRLIFPGSALWAAHWALDHQFGVFNWVET